jgi:hypothetical protein
VATYALQKIDPEGHRDHRGHRVSGTPYAPYADGGYSGNDACDGMAPEFWEQKYERRCCRHLAAVRTLAGEVKQANSGRLKVVAPAPR